MLQNHFQFKYQHYKNNVARLAGKIAKQITDDNYARIYENIKQQMYWRHLFRIIRYSHPLFWY